MYGARVKARAFRRRERQRATEGENAYESAGKEAKGDKAKEKRGERGEKRETRERINATTTCHSPDFTMQRYTGSSLARDCELSGYSIIEWHGGTESARIHKSPRVL